ncbi:MAG: xanthine dehydrogenase family protein molybdopterin-binding subunit [Rhodospirillaceae bacterium]|jgi:aerobic carbon-monoxide dehydrogenase large subunit|nr:xanthine dehydrogenase family protein molybdopterin-binding subunit [Rhodospirillaceae bacterium]MBT5456025.1 xanthine dehydrogenase family protein molybdopterin-binding subunit [Rhodospirillaceae bacterium]
MANGTNRLLGHLGDSVQRLEDPPLITGQGRFAGDINFPDQIHMRIVRSPQAHGEIKSINTDAAKAVPGVVAVWTSDDIEDVPPIDFREGSNPALALFRQYALARERVRYVGDPVAAVFAEDAYVAEDAAELVEIEIDELPVLINADDPPQDFKEGYTTEAALVEQSYGDMEAAFANAYKIVEVDVKIGRHTGVPLECRGAVGRYDAARDILELHGAAKVPHRNRETLCRMLDRPASGVHLFEGHTGGGFGIRGELYPEDVLVCVAAMRLRRPVKWIEDRQEHLMAANHSRQQRHICKAAVAEDGEVVAIDDELYLDQGGYIRTHGTRVANMTTGTLPGPYRIPVYRSLCHFRLTNKTPAATYRSPGRFESTFVRERLMDKIAVEMDMDPVALRRRNLIALEEMPYWRDLDVLGDSVEHDPGDYAGLLDQGLAHVRWDELQAELKQRREAGELVGCGLSMFFEKSGLGPSDGAKIFVDTTGHIEVVTGGASLGQGFETAMAQICAEDLGTDYRRIRVVHGRTDRIDYGVGAHASRATVLTGSAVSKTALKVREKALEVASELLQTPAESLTITDGVIHATDNASGPSVTLGDVAAALAPAAPTRGDRDPYLAAEEWFNIEHQTYPYGHHIAVVKVDRETGNVEIEKYFIGYDIGRAINPMLIEGQLVGGLAQGIGASLFEEFTYDERGEPLSVTFADYLLPTLHEIPEPEILLTEDYPSIRTPLGIKGAGEAGITGAAAAMASAIDNAIGVPGAVTQIPVTPQRLKKIMDERLG